MCIFIQRLLNLWHSYIVTPLNTLLEPFLLLSRLYIAKVFFTSGLTKIQDWETTVALFTDEYKIPFLTQFSPTMAAVAGTTGELVLPILLALGIGGRFAALGLFVVNAVAVISLNEIAPAALQQHILWAWILAMLAIKGIGRWSVDTMIKQRCPKLSDMNE